MELSGKYHPALDGLRAYLAFAVLAYHTSLSCFWLGWIGVHLFFVLSGFLITTILLDSKEAENYFKVFYARRFLRIFPIYYLVLFGVIIIALLHGNNIHALAYYIFYIQNFKLAFHNWNISDFPKWLNHTWTLAIEEQFYIFFPLLVRFLKEKTLTVVCFLLIGLAIFTRYYLSIVYPGNTINWGNTLSNFDFLASGALLAIGIRHLQPKIILRFLWLAFGLFLACFFVFDKAPFRHPIYLNYLHGQLFLVGLLLFATITVFTLVTKQNGIIRLLFENRFVVYIGKISYGLYLYHYPFFQLTDYLSNHYMCAYVNQTWFTWLLVVFKFAGAITIAGLSFEFFEKKILKLKDRFTYKFTESST